MFWVFYKKAKLFNRVAFLYTTGMTYRYQKSFLPNKIKLVVLGIFALGFIFYGIFYSYKEKKNKQNLEQSPLEITFLDNNDGRFLDSDRDGVYDWVENLWPELDPFNPDSDGDGVLDGKYIKQKQNIREKERRGDSYVESTLTESEKLGRSIYTALLAIDSSGGNINEETEKQISDNISGYISDLSLGSKMYIRDELSLVPDTKENSYKYRDDMNKFFAKNTVNTSDINLMFGATENREIFSNELEVVAIKYTNYIKDLSKIKVPYAIASRQTQLLNAVGQLEGALKNLISEDYDDLVMLSSLCR